MDFNKLTNNRVKTSTNKASKDKGSILIDTKYLLKIYETRVIAEMPKVQRIEGTGNTMRTSLWEMIRNFHLAYSELDKGIKLLYIRKFLANYYIFLTAFELAIELGHIQRDGVKINIAERMESIRTALDKWKNYLSSEIER